MDKIKLLIVDDHDVLRDALHALLSLSGDIEVVGEASEGAEAVEKVRELSPDVVLMDLYMPKMGGLQATKCIKKKYPGVKILVLTQYDNKEYILSSIKAGASGCLPKRALGSELMAAIRLINQGNPFLYPSVASALIEDYRQKTDQEPLDRLTPRMQEILRMIAEGNTSRQISEKLGICLKTVNSHRAKLMEKLDIHNRTELIKYAVRKGLVKWTEENPETGSPGRV